jgi:hypothetical protein
MKHYFVQFETVKQYKKACIKNEIIKWHIKHGWVYNVWSNVDEKYIGIFYCTLLAGDGVVLHFLSCERVLIHPVDIYSAFKQGIELMKSQNIVLATIPKKLKLCRIAKRLGFKEIALYNLSGEEIILFMLQK